MLRLVRTLALPLLLAASSLAASAQDGVIYHIDDTSAQALKALRNIRNHLDVDPSAKITVVTHAFGVDFLMQGMKDRSDASFEGPVAALASRGVKFEICEITLKNRNLTKEQFLQEASFTPSGVVRLAKLQQQGYAYIKP
jgi:intracellular sulfur oxidation DsrE/DsrF family protein